MWGSEAMRTKESSKSGMPSTREGSDRCPSNGGTHETSLIGCGVMISGVLDGNYPFHFHQWYVPGKAGGQKDAQLVGF